MRDADVVVVGAGVGGLVAALTLARHGLHVCVLERAASPGGKMRREQAGGQDIDAGPTVLTRRDIFEAIFHRAGSNLSDEVTLRSAETLARHWWPDGSSLDLFADAERSTDAIGRFAGLREAEGYRRFRRAAADIYATLESTFVEASRPSLGGLIGRVGVLGLPRLARIQPFASMWSELGRYFTDPRLRQLFGRYATYCGSSPFTAPATLMLVAHVESAGVWTIDGGMHRLSAALAGLAVRNGVEFRYGTDVASIETAGGRVSAARLASGERVAAGSMIWNGDAGALGRGLAGAGAAAAGSVTKRADRSLSAMTWAGAADPGNFALSHHNVFFCGDYEAEFRDIFERSRTPRSPTLYVCAQDRPAAASFERAPGAGRERLLMLMNAPASGDTTPRGSWEIPQCQSRALQHLANCGLSLTGPSDWPLMRTPTDYEAMFPGTGGALYGRASHGWMASFQRPGSRTRLANLYLAGGSTHPGPGVPMAALSGQLAAQALISDLTSRGALRPAAMPGGTSTA